VNLIVDVVKCMAAELRKRTCHTHQPLDTSAKVYISFIARL
jgi:hypothetical protein